MLWIVQKKNLEIAVITTYIRTLLDHSKSSLIGSTQEPENRINGRVAPAVKNMKRMVSLKTLFTQKSYFIYESNNT